MSEDPDPSDSASTKRLVVVGDRVLIKPDDEHKTKVGLYLPQGAVDKKQVRGGLVVATGPGTPLPDPTADEDEPWKHRSSGRFMPMQSRRGDYALFFRRSAVDLSYEGEDYVVVPESSILILIREGEDESEELFE